METFVVSLYSGNPFLPEEKARKVRRMKDCHSYEEAEQVCRTINEALGNKYDENGSFLVDNIYGLHVMFE